MANEFKHKSVGTGIASDAAYQSADMHTAGGQQAGDVLYFNGATGCWERTNALQIVSGAPALGANLNANSHQITLLDTLSLVGDGVLKVGVDNSTMHISGGNTMNAAAIRLRGKSHPTLPGRLELNTPNAALNEANRMLIQGAADVAAVTWMNCLHSGFVLGTSLNANGQSIEGVTYISRAGTTAQNLVLYGRGIATGDSAVVVLRGSTDASANGAFDIFTPNAARNDSPLRFRITGAADVAEATLGSNVITKLRNDFAGDSVPLTIQNLSGTGTPRVYMNWQITNGILGQIGSFVGQPANNGGALTFLTRNGATGYMSEVLRLTTAYHDTGDMMFGTYSAKGAEAFAGYITVYDLAGNARKLMVCA